MKFKVSNFDLQQTLECGQCFRFKKIEDNHYIIIAKNILEIKQNGEILDFVNINTEEFYQYWYNYFDFGTNYEEIKKDIIKNQPFMKEIIKTGEGIHILKQDPFETILSFIISENKRIPQIQNCIELLCSSYGEKIEYNGESYFLFPTIDVLKNLTIDDFRKCKVGLRDKYLYSTVQKIANKEFDISDSTNIEERLTQLYGIGPKVAACISLFAYHNLSVFPIDTWIRKTMINLYFNDEKVSDKKIKEKSNIFGKYKGIAQQYLFYNSRK